MDYVQQRLRQQGLRLCIQAGGFGSQGRALARKGGTLVVPHVEKPQATRPGRQFQKCGSGLVQHERGAAPIATDAVRVTAQPHILHGTGHGGQLFPFRHALPGVALHAYGNDGPASRRLFQVFAVFELAKLFLPGRFAIPVCKKLPQPLAGSALEYHETPGLR